MASDVAKHGSIFCVDLSGSQLRAKANAERDPAWIGLFEDELMQEDFDTGAGETIRVAVEQENSVGSSVNRDNLNFKGGALEECTDKPVPPATSPLKKADLGARAF